MPLGSGRRSVLGKDSRSYGGGVGRYCRLRRFGGLRLGNFGDWRAHRCRTCALNRRRDLRGHGLGRYGGRRGRGVGALGGHDTKCRETQGQQRGKHNDNDAHHTLRNYRDPTRHKVKAQIPASQRKRGGVPSKMRIVVSAPKTGPKIAPIRLSLAAEFILPAAHRAGQRQRRCHKNAARNSACHDVSGDRAEAGQAEVRIAQRPAASRGRKHHVAIERRVYRVDRARRPDCAMTASRFACALFRAASVATMTNVVFSCGVPLVRARAHPW